MADDPTVEIKIWMLKTGHSVTGVADAIGLKHCGPVSKWLRGIITSRTIESFFRDAGCPEEHIKHLKIKRQEMIECQRTGCR